MPLKRNSVDSGYAEYLRDESRLVGAADSISFPTTEEELCAELREAGSLEQPVTIQGARTGIAGGAVPRSGHVLNLSRMNRVLGLREGAEGTFLVTVQPGVILSDLRKAIASGTFDTAAWDDASLRALTALRDKGPFIFPPDPTETSAAIGGMASCNASGALSFHYGPTREYITRLRVVLVSGEVVALARGGARATGRRFVMVTEGGRRLSGLLPAYAMPDVKNAAGYYAADNMDLVDLFIGADGTLGVLSELELRLVPAPGAAWGLTAFFPDPDAALAFVLRLRDSAGRPAALEFFDAHALELLRTCKQENPAFKDLPALAEAWDTAVYVEYHGADDEAVEESVAGMCECMVACGGDDDATWLASEPAEMQRLKDFRHAIPEAVNLLIDERRREAPGLTKLGTDLAVPDGELEAVLSMYRGDLEGAGLEYVIFGHVGNNHVHVNILPRDMDDYAAGKALTLRWAREVVIMGGSVSAEHGIGKLKVALLQEMYGKQGIADMRRLKAIFDPDARLNAGNLFDQEGLTA